MKLIAIALVAIFVFVFIQGTNSVSQRAAASLRCSQEGGVFVDMQFCIDTSAIKWTHK